MLCYLLHARPFASRIENLQEVINEFILLFAAYTLVYATKYVPSAELRFNLGWSNVSHLGICILINLAFISVATFKQLKLYFKWCKNKLNARAKKKLRLLDLEAENSHYIQMSLGFKNQ